MDAANESLCYYVCKTKYKIIINKCVHYTQLFIFVLFTVPHSSRVPNKIRL